MRGLRWVHILLITLSVFFLWGIARADSPYSVDYSIISATWNGARTGFKNLKKAEEEAANRLDDQLTANSQGTPNYGICDSATVDSGAVEINAVNLNQLKGLTDQSRLNVVTILGTPYCQTQSGLDAWKYTNGKLYIISSYSPIIAKIY